MWQEIEVGAEWIVDADLKDYISPLRSNILLTPFDREMHRRG